MTLAAERLRDILTYEPETGKFYWKARPGKGVRTAGTEAGHFDGRYRQVTIDYRTYFTHRLAWLYVYGEWPKDYIDHINGDRLDNRIANLRDVTNQENHHNRRLHRSNKAGVSGVYLIARSGKWTARITVACKPIHLGNFNSKDEAITARLTAERRYGYHPNHGRAA
jgi:hypothetical protein